jgi:hypothetical protein
MMYKNGSPGDRGSADRYYGRQPQPHYWPSGTLKGYRVEQADMTPEQVAEYWEGYDNETDQKDWA